MTPDISASPLSQADSDDEVNLLELVAVIFRRKAAFALAFLTVFIAAALYTFLMKPVYEASSTLHVKEENGKAGLLGDLMSLNSANPINAELEILKSRTNAEQVVRRLHLDWAVAKKSDDLVFTILDFTSSAEKPVYHIKLTGPDTFSVRDDDGKPVGEGKAGVLMTGKSLTLLLNNLHGRKGDHFQLTLVPFDDAVKKLQGGIVAVEQGRQTNIIRVSYASTDPYLARDVVNTLVQAYLEQSIAFKSEEASRAVGFVEEQLKGLRDDLDNSEKNLQTYKSSSGVVKLDSEAQALIEKLSETERGRTEVTLRRKQLEFALAALKEAMRHGRIYSPGIMKDDPLVAGFASKLSDLEVQRRALRSDYTETYPAVKAVQAQIEEVQKKIQATYETGLANLIREQETIARQIDVYEGKMRNLPETERDLARLTRISKVNADIYTFLLQKHEEARIAKASTISNINVVDPAIAPNKPIKPKKAQYLLLGLLFGIMFGIGFAFFQEFLDDTIKNGDEAKRVLGLPLLATIPHIPSYDPKAKRRGKKVEEEQEQSPLITQSDPRSVVSEAFRALRTSIHFSAINREKKIMLVTSTFPAEGKSIIAANLASILSQTGARVLIVDCDMRRASLHEKFGQDKIPGLSEILTGDVTFAEAVQATSFGVDLISAGTNPPNPSELLGSEAMRQFLLKQRDNYDSIVIDAPPVLAVSDAPVLTVVSDLVLLVVEAGRVPVKVAQHMRETLATFQAPVAGLVINDKTGKGESYGYYGGHYYRYGYRYGYGYGYGYGYYSDDNKPGHKKTSPLKKILSFLKKD